MTGRLADGDEAAQAGGQVGGLVFGYEGVAVGYLDELAVRERMGESLGVIGWHQAVLDGPRDEYRPPEGRERGCGGEQVSLAPAGVAGVFAVVAADLPPGQRLQPGAHDLLGYSPFGHVAEEHRQLPEPPR